MIQQQTPVHPKWLALGGLKTTAYSALTTHNRSVVNVYRPCWHYRPRSTEAVDEMGKGTLLPHQKL